MTATILHFPAFPSQGRVAFPLQAPHHASFPASPHLPKPRTVTLLRLDGSLFATAGFFPGDPGAPWAWIAETVSAEAECREDEVHVLESEEDGDVITAQGIPVCRVAF